MSADAINRTIKLIDTALEFNKTRSSKWRYTEYTVQSNKAIAVYNCGNWDALVTLDEVIKHRMKNLTDYQNAEHAKQFRNLVFRAQQSEESKTNSLFDFANAVTLNAYKLMLYKTNMR